MPSQSSQTHDTNTTNSNSTERTSQSSNTTQNNSSIRQSLGNSLSTLSNTINDHIILARYGTIASITLLAAYGVSKTPLFFRYKNVNQIPSKMFVQRRKIYGRIVHVVEESNSMSNGGFSSSRSTSSSKPIVCLVRHLSPMGYFMNRSTFEVMMRLSPFSKVKSSSSSSSSLRSKSDNYSQSTDLLRIELAGIQSPPLTSSQYYYSPSESRDEWLRKLAENQTFVVCTLLYRRIVPNNNNTETRSNPIRSNNPQHKQTSNDTNQERITYSYSHLFPQDQQQQTAICHLQYRPKNSLFRMDIATSLIRYGRAVVLSNGLYYTDDSTIPTIDNVHSSNDNNTSTFTTTSSPRNPMKHDTISPPNHTTTTKTMILDGSTKIKDLQNDIRYLEKLSQEEIKAVSKGIGIWSIPDIRNMRSDLVEEADFETNANVFQKLWRWMRG